MKPALFYLTAITIIVADQVSKWSIVNSMPWGTSRPILGNILYLTSTRNTGGAFSLFPAGNSTFIVVAFLAVGALIYAFHRYQRGNTLVSTALSLALGGAIGNLIDRVRLGYVIDFFDLHAGTDHTVWPIFNIADSAITVGIFLLAAHFLFAKEEPTAREAGEPIAATDNAGPALDLPAPMEESVIQDDRPLAEPNQPK